jgi:hypothetical protein
MRLLSLTVVVPLVFAAGCRRPDYFPLREGQVFNYAGAEYRVEQDDTTAAGEVSYALLVRASLLQPSLGRVYAVELARDGENWMSFFFRKTRDAVFVMPGSHLDGYEPTPGWEKMLGLPLRAGAFWYGDIERSLSFEVMAREDVRLERGLCRGCFRLRVHAPEPWTLDLWLAPGSGIVKWARRLGPSRFEAVELAP